MTNLLATSLFTFGDEYGWTGLLLRILLERGLELSPTDVESFCLRGRAVVTVPPEVNP